MSNNNARPNATRLGVELLEARTVPATFGTDQGLSLAVGDVIPGFTDYEYVTGTGPGKLGLVQVFDANGNLKYKVNPFTNYTGGVFVAIGDVNGDGQKDIICSTATGSTGRVRVYSFINQKLSDLGRFMPFGANYIGGIQITTGDVTGDAADEIIVGQQTGGSWVKVFGATPNGTGGLSYFQLRRVRAFGPGYTGGVSVAATNIDQNNVAGVFDPTDYAEIIVGKASQEPLLKILDAQQPTITTRAKYFAFDTNIPSASGGIDVFAGSTDGTGVGQIYAVRRNSTTVRIINGETGVPIDDFTVPYPVIYGRNLNIAINNLDDPRNDIYNVTDLFVVAGDGPYLQVPIIFPGATDSPAGLNGSQAAP